MLGIILVIHDCRFVIAYELHPVLHDVEKRMLHGILRNADVERMRQILEVAASFYALQQLARPSAVSICTGLAASMGAVLLTSGAAGKRSALPHARVMIHQPLGGAQGQASDIEITAREILRTKRELYEILAKHSGVDYEKIERDADRDYWLSAAEAREYGLIDQVLTKREIPER